MTRTKSVPSQGNHFGEDVFQVINPHFPIESPCFLIFFFFQIFADLSYHNGLNSIFLCDFTLFLLLYSSWNPCYLDGPNSGFNSLLFLIFIYKSLFFKVRPGACSQKRLGTSASDWEGGIGTKFNFPPETSSVLGKIKSLKSTSGNLGQWSLRKGNKWDKFCSYATLLFAEFSDFSGRSRNQS